MGDERDGKEEEDFESETPESEKTETGEEEETPTVEDDVKEEGEKEEKEGAPKHDDEETGGKEEGEPEEAPVETSTQEGESAGREVSEGERGESKGEGVVAERKGAEGDGEDSRRKRLLSALGRYAADHTIHLAVVVVLGLYPGVHHIVTNSVPATEFILPPVGIVTGVFYFGLFAMSFDFISGYTGYLSLGHAAFYGIGAYTVLMVANGLFPMTSTDTMFMTSLLIAGIISVVLAIVIGLVSFRLRGFYFAMITLGFTQVMYVFISRWSYPVGEGRDPAGGISANPDAGFELGIPFVDIVNLEFQNQMLKIGSNRIYGDSVSSLFNTGIQVSAESVSYYIIGVTVLLCYLAMQRIIHSPFGSVMVAIRENEERARAIGYNVFAYKIAAFCISAFFAAIAGGLFAGYQRTATPDETFFFMTSADAILASVIGGFGTLAGPLYGRLIQGTFENFLNEAPFVPDVFAPHDLLFLGIIFILFVLYLPTGIVGAIRSRLGGKVANVVGEKVSEKFSNYFSNF